MDTILETNADVISVRLAYDGNSDQPRPEWVRGTCPKCGEVLISNCYYVGGRGYIVEWQCWAGAKEISACDYRRVL